MAATNSNRATPAEIRRKCKNSANLARRTVKFYAEKAGSTENELETNVTDLLADLVHLCNAKGIDFDKALLQAFRYHEAEVTGDF